VVLIEGREKRIRTEPNYLPSRVDHYAEGSVEVLEASLEMLRRRIAKESLPAHPEGVWHGGYGGNSDFKVTLRSRVALSGGLIAIVIYSQSALVDSAIPTAAEIAVRSLPELPANEKVSIAFRSKAFTYRAGQDFFVQVFDREGRELMSNEAPKAWPYYAAMERSQLRDTLRRLKPSFAGKDLEARPVLTIRPLLPKQVARPTDPVMAQLSISAEGTVTDVQVGATTPDLVGQAVREALAGWLFIPRIRKGEPVMSNVRIPITF